ncbi:phage major capsid protein [Hansschlegelia beijingensis]|uniref:HK97 family phage major capsid protein n=1 Tax=Hansschlegelia beijingensis TaxID=1133344 RepID=A0A7W6CYU8_9HYPH|nr:phage major capsid protein [Hansschlegelia beijingensis]MBB3972774.1 HK97 family phage major capsid protein [Hansschlegelia beijingensis]
MTLAEIRAKQAELVAQARAAFDEIKTDTPEARATELEAQHDAAMKEHDKLEARAAREIALSKAQAALEESADDRAPRGEDRAQKAADTDTRTAEERYAEAFESFLRRGRSGLSAEQRAVLVQAPESRAQSVGTNTAGGYLVPVQFQEELIKSLKAWGPMLDPGVALMLRTATGAEIPFPTMDDTSNVGALIAENTQVSQSEVAFGTKTIGAYKYTSGVVLVSDELLQDSVLDVEAIIREAMAERIGRIGNTHLTTGDGADKPHGFITAATTTAAAAAAAITFDDMIELYHSVDPAYRSAPKVGWQFNDGTLKLLRKLKDAESRYIWQPADAKLGAPATILDKPYAVNQAIANVGSNAKSVAFGDFDKYVVRMVNEFAIKRLVERYADYGQVGFIGFTRIDGELLDTKAIKVLTHPSS